MDSRPREWEPTAVRIDPRTTPISRRGSWMSLAVLEAERSPPRGPGLYLRTNRARPIVSRDVFRIVPSAAGPLDYRGSPGTIVVDSADRRGMIELLFDGNGTLRIVGTVAFRLESAFVGTSRRENTSHAVAYLQERNRIVVNARSWLRRYGVEVLSGSVELDAPWDGEVTSRADITVRPDAGGAVEVAIDEFRSTWIAPTRRPVELVRRSLTDRWREYISAFPAVEERYRPAARRAAALIWMCTQSPDGLLRREAIFMSLNWMDAVWSWDNWINMAGIAGAHPTLAFDQFRVVADHQDAYGAYPDAVDDGFIHYNFSKPPVQGVIIRRLEDTVPEFWTAGRVREAYPSIAAFTRWWLTHRRSRGDDLCHYLHGNDSGWDNSTLLRAGVPIVTADLNAYLVVQCRVLARWAVRLGLAEEERRYWNDEGDRIRDALLRELWRDGRFVARRLPGGAVIDSHSLSSGLPALLGEELPHEVRRGLVAWFAACETEWGLATESPESPYYEADNYWRGPIWAPSTLMAVMGLRALGENAAADRIEEKFLRLVERSGFAENFHPETGSPLVDPAYTWTAAVFLSVAYGRTRTGPAR